MLFPEASESSKFFTSNQNGVFNYKHPIGSDIAFHWGFNLIWEEAERFSKAMLIEFLATPDILDQMWFLGLEMHFFSQEFQCGALLVYIE